MCKFFWKSNDEFLPISRTELRHMPIIELLKNAYYLYGTEYLRCVEVAKRFPWQPDKVFQELSDELELN